jgi:AmmeMemoRadiSam system protein B
MSDAESSSGSPIRRSPIAGTWYPDRPEILTQTIRNLLAGSEAVQAPGDLVALVSPHAGLRYSGPVAAAGYRLLEQKRFDTAVLLGPSHCVRFQGASVFSHGAFETPLGRVLIDEELAGAIEARDRRLHFMVEAHDREHCLEMQLPFLQVLAPGISIVPIVMGEQDRANVEAVAAALGDAIATTSKRILLIASSDLSHYKSAKTASSLDGQVADLVEKFEPDELMELLERNPEHACGGGPIVAVLKAARALGAGTARIMQYGDSGDVTGDKTEVVGYLSAAVFN